VQPNDFPSDSPSLANPKKLLVIMAAKSEIGYKRRFWKKRWPPGQRSLGSSKGIIQYSSFRLQAKLI